LPAATPILPLLPATSPLIFLSCVIFVHSHDDGSLCEQSL